MRFNGWWKLWPSASRKSRRRVASGSSLKRAADVASPDPTQCVELLEQRQLLTADFVDPNPSPYNAFGTTIVPLSTGNVVVTSPYADVGGTDTGAVYLFNGTTGELISSLFGSTTRDFANTEITQLSNGNFVVASPSWDNGLAVDAGAVA